MKKYLIILLLVALVPAMVNAEIFPKAGTAGLQFLKLGVGGRGMALGGTAVSITDDIEGLYWNPGAVALNDRSQVFFSHTKYFVDVMHDYAAYSHPTLFGVFSAYGSVLHMPEMDVVDEASWGPTGEKFNCSSMEFGLSFSNRFTDKFSFGITGKFLRQNLEEESVNGYAFDLGSIYNTGFRNLKIGMALKNYGPDLKYELDSDEDGEVDEDPFDLIDNDGDGLIDEDGEEFPFKIPMMYTLGFSLDVYNAGSQRMIAAMQVKSAVDSEEIFSTGLEYKYSMFAVRGGYEFSGEDNDKSFTAGLGFEIPTSFAIFNVDYSYTQNEWLSDSFMESPHRLTVKMFF